MMCWTTAWSRIRSTRRCGCFKATTTATGFQRSRRRSPKWTSERTRLVTAIATGGPLEGLLEALRAREYQRTTLEADRSAMCSATRHAQLHKSGDARGHTGGHSDRNGRCEIRENRKREVVKSEAVLKWRPQRDSRPGAARLRGSFGRPDRMRSHMAFWAVTVGTERTNRT